jgi:hypothetical protein
MTPKKQHNEILAARTIKNLEKRGFEAWYVSDAAQARDFVKNLIPPGTSVSWGGAMTLEEAGIMEVLRSGDYSLLDRGTAQTQEEVKAIYRQAFSCDWYLTSTNALSLDGVLVNRDGTGNRAAALIYGPENVLVVAGVNKITPDQEAALERVKNTASPANALRLNRDTPCAKTGTCADCLVEDCICSHTVFTRRSRPAGRIKVLLVGEDLGY